MNLTDRFTAAFALPQPWHVTALDFKAPDDATSQAPKELHIQIDFMLGSRFSFPGDASRKLFRARVPRIKNGEGKISIQVPCSQLP